jgi:hypothetical protein
MIILSFFKLQIHFKGAPIKKLKVSGIRISQPSCEIFCMSFLNSNYLNSLPDGIISGREVKFLLGLNRLLKTDSI